MKNLHKAQRTQKSQTSDTVLFGNKLNGASANAKGVNTIIKGVDAHINTIKVIMGGGEVEVEGDDSTSLNFCGVEVESVHMFLHLAVIHHEL